MAITWAPIMTTFGLPYKKKGHQWWEYIDGKHSVAVRLQKSTYRYIQLHGWKTSVCLIKTYTGDKTSSLHVLFVRHTVMTTNVSILNFGTYINRTQTATKGNNILRCRSPNKWAQISCTWIIYTNGSLLRYKVQKVNQIFSANDLFQHVLSIGIAHTAGRISTKVIRQVLVKYNGQIVMSV